MDGALTSHLILMVALIRAFDMSELQLCSFTAGLRFMRSAKNLIGTHRQLHRVTSEAQAGFRGTAGASPFHKSLACIIATNVSPPDSYLLPADPTVVPRPLPAL